MIHHTHCPVCQQLNIRELFSAKDFTVSGKTFPVWQCGNCTALFTQDVPGVDEIGPYYQSENYISHSDTRKGLVNRLYHTVRSVTLTSKYTTIRSETGLDKGMLLDIGCGTGAFLHTMKQKGWETTGLEPDATARQKALQLYGITPSPSHELFNLKPATYDAITMWHVLEHVHDLHAYIEQARLLLKDSGRLFIAVPNYTSTDAGLYQSYWAAYDVPRHLYHFSPDSMRKLMSVNGMHVKKVLPMWFDSFYVCLLSEQYRATGWKLFRPVKAFANGLLSNMTALGNKEKCSSLIYVIEKVNR